MGNGKSGDLMELLKESMIMWIFKQNIADVEKEFHCAVDDYLIFCSEVEKEPEKEYKGTFNVRIKPELHKKLAFKALEDGDSLNKAVEKAIAVYLSDAEQMI